MQYRNAARSLSLHTPLAIFALGVLSPLLAAQCRPGWQSDFGLPGTDGSVNASVMWDPDGPGPRGPLLVFGGSFTKAGNNANTCIGTYDLQTGEVGALGNLTSSSSSGSPTGAFAFEVLENGDLVAGGSFYLPGSFEPRFLVRWNGSQWVNFDYQPTGTVFSLRTLANGDLIIGGSSAGSVSSLIRWRDGVATNLLQSFASTFSLPVGSITQRPNGDLVICSRGESSGSVGYIAELTSSGWVLLGGASGVGTVPYEVKSLRNGDLIAVGQNITVAEGNPTNTRTTVARFDGQAWHRLGPDGQFPVSNTLSVAYSIAELPDGRLAVGGTFSDVSNPGTPQDIRLWDGSQWADLDDHIATEIAFVPTQKRIRHLAILPDSELVAMGTFTSTSPTTSTPVYNIARFDGSAWRRIAGGFSKPDGSAGATTYFTGFAPLRDGRLFIQGNFTWAGTNPVNGAAIFDGTDWHEFAPGPLPGLRDAVALADGSLVFRGTFTTVGGVPARGLVRWTPINSFENIGDPAGDAAQVQSILALPQGGFVASGSFTSVGGVPANNIARWDGSGWSPLGTGLDAAATQLIVSPQGGLIASGNFTQAGGQPANHIARWDGAQWVAFGNGVPVPAVIAAGSDGRVFAANSVDGSANNLSVQVWNGSAWTPGFGDLANRVLALASTEQGDVAYLALRNPPPVMPFIGSPVPAFGIVSDGTTHPLDYAVSANTLYVPYSLRGDAEHQFVLINFLSTLLVNPDSGAPEVQPQFYNRFILSCPPTCDPDLNLDGVADQGDVDYLINVIAGGNNPNRINPDFNADGVTDQGDIDTLINVIAGGPCP